MLKVENYIKTTIQNNENPAQRKFILTGGPGVGKSSIIQNLSNKGFVAVTEAAEEISKEALKMGILSPWCEPWFEDRVIELQKQQYCQATAEQAQTIFFDRGPIDPLTYQLRNPSEPNKNIIQAVEQSLNENLYDKMVFLIENLGFCNQNEYRKESNEDSLAIGRDLELNYAKLGYTIIRVPAFPELEEKQSIEKRVEFILRHIFNH
jgi:predicted ATPase